MNILFLTPRLPYPTIGGDRLKPFKLLSHLSENHKVTLVSFYQGKNNPEDYIKEIEKFGIKVHVIRLNPLSSAVNCLLNIPRLKPLEISYYFNKKFKKKIDELMQIENFDLGFSFFMRTAEYLKGTSLNKVLIAEDNRTIYQMRSYQTSKNILQKIVRFYEYFTLKKYEPKIIKYFDKTTFVTNEDISFTQNKLNTEKLRLLSNGTEVDKFIPENFEERSTILFTGKLDVWANQIMVKRITSKILPVIKKEFPKVKMVIAGVNPPKFIKKLHSNKEIELHENVPSVIPFLQKAIVYLHPHEGGSGIQNKLLEAMSCGCPVVTTSSGNQGINGIHRVHLLICNNDNEIASNVIELLKNRELAEIISMNARNLILETHSWDRIYNDLDNIIKEFDK